MNVNDPKQFIDHINGNTFDNRKENLRFCTRNENMWNRSASRSWKKKPPSSKYKGVYKDKSKNRWRAEIYCNCRRYTLGSFISEADAATAYNEAAIKLHKNFAKLNIIQED